MMLIGVLALQGDSESHISALKSRNVDVKAIKLPEQLTECDALVLPGGESSAMLKLMQPLNFFDAIKEFHTRGGAILGTCAGMILLAKNVAPKQPSMSLIDIDVQRNAYGHQTHSGTQTTTQCDPALGTKQFQATLIRAPQVFRVGKKVKILASINNLPICCQQEKVLVCSFHPEVTCSDKLKSPVIDYFLNSVIVNLATLNAKPEC